MTCHVTIFLLTVSVYKLHTCLLESKIRGTSCIFPVSGIECSSRCIFMECYYLVTFTLVMCI